MSRRFHDGSFFAKKILSWGAAAIVVALLASSTITDSLQKLSDDGFAELTRMAGGADVTSAHEQERLALLRRTASNVDAIRSLSAPELLLLFGEPALKREEGKTVSWHYTSVECALDVYFPNHDRLTRPVYAEYRVRGEVSDSGGLVERTSVDHRSCVRALFSHAKSD